MFVHTQFRACFAVSGVLPFLPFYLPLPFSSPFLLHRLLLLLVHHYRFHCLFFCHLLRATPPPFGLPLLHLHLSPPSPPPPPPPSLPVLLLLLYHMISYYCTFCVSTFSIHLAGIYYHYYYLPFCLRLFCTPPPLPPPATYYRYFTTYTTYVCERPCRLFFFFRSTRTCCRFAALLPLHALLVRFSAVHGFRFPHHHLPLHRTVSVPLPPHRRFL